MYLTDLADACRTSGLKVVEVAGWKSRGHGGMEAASTVVLHHTATPDSAEGKAGSVDRPLGYPTLALVRDGRAGLAGPLSQLGLGRDGTVYVIAAGQCYHAGLTFLTRQSNRYSIGIEAEHPGGTTPWPEAQYAAYVKLAAALSSWYGISVDRIEGHREVASPRGRKTDPNFDLEQFRLDVARRKIAPEEDVNLTDKVGTNPATGEPNTVQDALQISQHYAFRAWQETLAQKATLSAMAGAIKALQEGEAFDEVKLLESIEETVRQGTAQAIVDAGRALGEVQAERA